MMRRLIVSVSISLFRCSLRILDSFGTDAEFNYAEYPSDGADFGGLDTHLRQILTMFRKILLRKLHATLRFINTDLVDMS